MPTQFGLPGAIIYQILNGKFRGNHLSEHLQSLHHASPEHTIIKTLIEGAVDDYSTHTTQYNQALFNALTTTTQKLIPQSGLENVVESTLESIKSNSNSFPLLQTILSIRKAIKPSPEFSSLSLNPPRSPINQTQATKEDPTDSTHESYFQSLISSTVRNTISYVNASGNSAQYILEIASFIIEKILDFKELDTKSIETFTSIHAKYDAFINLNGMFSLICEINACIKLANTETLSPIYSKNEEHSIWTLSLLAALTGKYTHQDETYSLEPSLHWLDIKNNFFSNTKGLPIPYLLYSCNISSDDIPSSVNKYLVDSISFDETREIYQSLPSQNTSLPINNQNKRDIQLATATFKDQELSPFQTLILLFKSFKKEDYSCIIETCIHSFSHDEIMSILPVQNNPTSDLLETDTLLQQIAKGHIEHVVKIIKETPTLITQVIYSPQTNIIPTLQIILSYLQPSQPDDAIDLGYWLYDKATVSTQPPSDHADKPYQPSIITHTLLAIKAKEQQQPNLSLGIISLISLLKTLNLIQTIDEELLINYFKTYQTDNQTQPVTEKSKHEPTWNEIFQKHKATSQSSIKAFLATLLSSIIPTKPIQGVIDTYLMDQSNNLDATHQISNVLWNSILHEIIRFALLFFVASIDINIAVSLVLYLPISTYTISQLCIGTILYIGGATLSLYATNKAWDFIGQYIFNKDLPKPVPVREVATSSYSFKHMGNTIYRACQNVRDWIMPQKTI
ncbi:MAG TPA: hypothetical protein QF353_06100 [Gammaproteobacteria bacterium]|nr:hypothetical protein [Gammaproteobacteria bacterium]